MDNAKQIVKEKYNLIAEQSREQIESSPCDCGSSLKADYSVFSEEYDNIEGYNPDADLGLGCGIPTEFAQINKGDTVLDLGSGAGNDCFIARALVGKSGRVIGVDITEAMVKKAKNNVAKYKYTNVEFYVGDIESLPLEDNQVDVVISNCVLNLVPDKHKAFKEIFRVLKPGGRISVSDVVLQGILPEKIAKAAEMYAGCVLGAMQKDEYLKIIHQNGLTNVKIEKEKKIAVPDEILLNHMTETEIVNFGSSGIAIYSITVYAEKPVMQ
jgi:arsenite methyltransferase